MKFRKSLLEHVMIIKSVDATSAVTINGSTGEFVNAPWGGDGDGRAVDGFLKNCKQLQVLLRNETEQCVFPAYSS